MQVVEVRREKSVKELVTRLFEIAGADAERKIKEVEDALLRANPELKEVDKLSPGRLIVIPRDVNLPRMKEATTLSEQVDKISAEVQQALDGLRRGLKAATTEDINAELHTLEVLNTDEVKRLTSNDAELKALVTKVARDSKTRMKQLKALRTFQDEMVSQLKGDFDRVIKQFTPHDIKAGE
jgi:hypothetical protein